MFSPNQWETVWHQFGGVLYSPTLLVSWDHFSLRTFVSLSPLTIYPLWLIWKVCFQFLDAVFNLPTECKSGYSWMKFLFMYHVSEGNYCKRHWMLDHGICHSTLRFSHTFKFECSIRNKVRLSNCQWKPDSNPVEWNGEQMVSPLLFFFFFFCWYANAR